MSTVLTADSLTLRYGAAAAIVDVSLRIRTGEFVAIVGPNGAGKSTLLGLLAGAVSPTSGTIVLAGTAMHDATASQLSLARSYLGQQPSGAIPFTVRQVVAMGRFPYRNRAGNTAQADEDAIQSALAATDTRAVEHRVFSTLSGGEAQRAHVARVMAQQAGLLLLDEPTAALDISHQELVMASLRDEAGGGRAVVGVVHDLNLGAIFADRLVLLREGSVAASGAPRDVLTEENLSEVYEHPVRVIEHPFRDAPLVLPIDSDEASQAKTDPGWPE